MNAVGAGVDEYVSNRYSVIHLSDEILPSWFDIGKLDLFN